MSAPQSVWTESALQSAQARMSAPAQLQLWRAEQLQQFLQQGLPSRHDENWRYTPPANWLECQFKMAEQQDISEKSVLPESLPADCYRLVFIDGVFSIDHSRLADLPEKITLTRCADRIKYDSDFYQKIEKKMSHQNLSVFHWLNGTLVGDGLYLSLAPGVQLTRPIHLLYLTTRHDLVMSHPRHILELGEGSRAVFLEEYRGLNASGQYLNNVMTQITVGANAQLHYYKLQREALGSSHIANTSITQGADSQVLAYHIALGARLNREDLNVILEQRGAHCQLSGFYYPQANQHIDFHTRIDHHSSHTSSQQYYKGLMGAQGHGVFNGKVIVYPQAQQVTAKQENHNLLLAKTAQIDTKPELQVLADNVQCTHGATVGDLDAQALFYLRSRGIPEAQARQLLMWGFAEEILQNSLPPIVDYARQAIQQEIGYAS